MYDKAYVEGLEKKLIELEAKTKQLYTKESTYDLIKYLIDLQQIKNNKLKRTNSSPESFLRENCTIKINIGRQQGHTNALRKYNIEKPATSLYVAINRTMTRDYTPGYYLEKFEEVDRTFTQKVFLLDNFLESHNEFIRAIRVISKNIILQGSLPVIIVT